MFGIGCTMSANTNNVSGIRGVTPPTENTNRGKIWFCAVKLPYFPALYTAASLDAAPSTPPPSVPPPPPSTSRHRRHQPCPDPTFGLDAAGGVPVAVPDPVAPSLTSSLTPLLRLVHAAVATPTGTPDSLTRPLHPPPKVSAV
jgi:hypothetical protein